MSKKTRKPEEENKEDVAASNISQEQILESEETKQGTENNADLTEQDFQEMMGEAEEARVAEQAINAESATKEDPPKGQAEMEELLTEAIKYNIDEIAKKEVAKRNWYTPEQTYKFFIAVASYHQISISFAFLAIVLLFNKGAANEATPSDLGVTLETGNGGNIEITKSDLEFAHNRLHRNKYIRRMAESLSTSIGIYSEEKGLAGDIAKRINTRLVADGKEPLSKIESAWASSFHQGNPILDTRHGLSRMSTLLAIDYASRFQKSDSKTKAKPNKSKKAKNKGGENA